MYHLNIDQTCHNRLASRSYGSTGRRARLPEESSPYDKEINTRVHLFNRDGNTRTHEPGAKSLGTSGWPELAGLPDL
jgi:hypothetical protein